MNRVAWGSPLLLVASLLAQQQGPPPYSPPPYSTPPTFPDHKQTAPPLPPDTKVPPPGQLSNPDAEKQIQQELNADPALGNIEVKALVDDKYVVLTGSVYEERQHVVALRIADSYAGSRRIVDKIQVRQRF